MRLYKGKKWRVYAGTLPTDRECGWGYGRIGFRAAPFGGRFYLYRWIVFWTNKVR